MRTRTLSAASVSVLLALAGNVAIAVAQDETPTEPADETATTDAISGTIVIMEDEDGRTSYFLDVEGTLIELQVGPAWFRDLGAVYGVSEGDEVEIVGNLRSGTPDENASDTAKEQAVKAPQLRIKSVDGESRPKGKPAWAGGPKVQGEAHPGYDGRSKGQAQKPEKPEKPGKPAHAGKPDKPPKGPRIPLDD
jgi:hypothetical protein